jgi:hypothetical protein
VEKIEVDPNGPGCLLCLDATSEVVAGQLLVAAGRAPAWPRTEGPALVVIERTSSAISTRYPASMWM